MRIRREVSLQPSCVGKWLSGKFSKLPKKDLGTDSDPEWSKPSKRSPKRKNEGCRDASMTRLKEENDE